MSVTEANPKHKVAYEDLCNLLNRHAADVPADQMLALAANMVGKIIALQDQRTMTWEIASEIVSRNIEMGNREVLAKLAKTVGTG